MEHGAKDVITQGNKILERSDVEDLNKKSDWAVLKRPSKRILEEGRSSTDRYKPGDIIGALWKNEKAGKSL